MDVAGDADILKGLVDDFSLGIEEDLLDAEPGNLLNLDDPGDDACQGPISRTSISAENFSENSLP
jgi:hypothetical protein